MGSLPLPLEAIFTAEGITAFAGVVVLVVQLFKRLSFVPVPEHGRGVLYAVAGVSAFLVAAATFDRGAIENAAAFVGVVLTWVTLSSASIGLYEAGSKAVDIATGNTNPSGPDER